MPNKTSQRNLLVQQILVYCSNFNTYYSNDKRKLLLNEMRPIKEKFILHDGLGFGYRFLYYCPELFDLLTEEEIDLITYHWFLDRI
jgi:hypothetical protein